MPDTCRFGPEFYVPVMCRMDGKNKNRAVLRRRINDLEPVLMCGLYATSACPSILLASSRLGVFKSLSTRSMTNSPSVEETKETYSI